MVQELTLGLPAEVAIPLFVELQVVMPPLSECMLLKYNARPAPLLQSALTAAGDACCAAASETDFMFSTEADKVLPVELPVGPFCAREVLGSLCAMTISQPGEWFVCHQFEGSVALIYPEEHVLNFARKMETMCAEHDGAWVLVMLLEPLCGCFVGCIIQSPILW